MTEDLGAPPPAGPVPVGHEGRRPETGARRVGRGVATVALGILLAMAAPTLWAAGSLVVSAAYVVVASLLLIAFDRTLRWLTTR